MGYGLTDFFTTSPAEAQRNKYRKLVNNLDRKIRSIESTLEYTDPDLRGKNSTMANNPDSAEGKISTTFEDRLLSHTNRSNELLTYYSNKLTELKGRRDSMAAKRDYYQAKCDEEDARRVEFRAGEL
jgi:hypothetical protein